MAACRRLAADAQFALAVLLSALLTASIYVYQAGAPHLFVVEQGLTPQAYGALGFATGGGYVAISSSLALRRAPFRPGRLAVAGALLAAAGTLAFLAEVALGWRDLAPLLAPLVVASLGMGMGLPAAAAAALARAGRAAGAASALLGFVTMAAGGAGTLAVALAGRDDATAMAAMMAASAACAIPVAALLRRRAVASAPATSRAAPGAA
jgi:DHA1 family bicyclomycin/chloramphenicol resistance-like MFS transporter